MDEKSRLRQFWLRVLLTVGMLWGTMPLITLPLLTRGPNDTAFDLLAAIFNSLTVLPACALAFWHRRVACIWLTVNAAIVLSAALTWMGRTKSFDLVSAAGYAGSVAIAACLDFMEIKRWPGALER